MLPPGGSPLPFAALSRGIAARGRGDAAADELKNMLGARFGQKHVFLSGSGRQALCELIRALKILRPERDEVLIPAYVSFSVPSAVVAAGCRVALYDLDPLTLAPDLAGLENALSERTLAVLLCPLFGLAFDASPAKRLCREYGAALVDDAAQSMGASVGEGIQSGTQGDAGIFSLSRGKPMTAVEGGILFTQNDDIANAVRRNSTRPPVPSTVVLLLKSLALTALRRPEFYRIPRSMPWLKIGESIFDPDFSSGGFSGFQAGLAVHALERLERVNAMRRENAKAYNEALGTSRQIRVISETPGTRAIYIRQPLVAAPGGQSGGAAKPWNRRVSAQAARLGVSPGFPLPIGRIPALAPHLAPIHARAKGGAGAAAFPGAGFLADNLVTLPTHDLMRREDRKAIIDFFLNLYPQPASLPGAKAMAPERKHTAARSAVKSETATGNRA